MEVSGQNGFKCDVDEKALQCLLHAFGPAFSLEEIASAYCKSGRNVDLAGEILSDMKGSSLTSTTVSSNAESSIEDSSESSDGFSSGIFHQERFERRNARGLKPKVRPVSVGTVSSMLGKDYARSTPSVNGSHCTTKPLKLDAKVLPMSEIWGDDSQPDISERDQLQQDQEDFLFKMLGEGFQLSRDVIREVLEICGYDMKKSIDKLLDQSPETLGKGTGVDETSKRLTDVQPKSEVPSYERKFQNLNDPRGSSHSIPSKGMESHGQQRNRNELQKEVLTALFNASERSEEYPRRIVKDRNKHLPSWQVVAEPPEESLEGYQTEINYLQGENLDEAEEDEEYQRLRTAVKEYRVTMNEYYKAAVDAYANGDHLKAEKLMDEGQFFHRKACEADEESNRMILDTRATEAQEMLLDLHDHGSRQAVRLLKSHLSSLAGIPSFKYLKVITDANDQDTLKGSRRQQVMKLLEEESIEWSAGETAGTILIRLDSIDRKRLSFLKK